MATLDILNYPKDLVAAESKCLIKRVNTNKEYMISYRITGWKEEVVDVEEIMETDHATGNNAASGRHEENGTANKDHDIDVGADIVVPAWAKTTSESGSQNTRNTREDLQWYWTNAEETVGQWRVVRTDDWQTRTTGSQSGSSSGTGSGKSQLSASVGVDTQFQENKRVSDTRNYSSNQNLTRERVTIRRNVLMLLRENTIAIDYRRITSSYPKWKLIREDILAYEELRGLDLDKVATVVITNIFIL